MTAIQQAARDRAVKFAQAAFPPSSMSGEESRDNHRLAVEQFIDDIIAAATPEEVAQSFAPLCAAYNNGRRPDGFLGVSCTLPPGHDGDHIATTIDGTELARWPQIKTSTYAPDPRD